MEKVHENPLVATRKIAQELNTDHTIVLDHFHSAGLVKKLYKQVLYELGVQILMDEFSH